jgi:hypothetical protein
LLNSALSNLDASIVAAGFLNGNAKNATTPLSPLGNSDWVSVVINAGMKKVFSYRRTAIAE